MKLHAQGKTIIFSKCQVMFSIRCELGLSAGTGKHCVFGRLGLVFI